MSKAVSEIQAKMKTWTDAGIELAYNSGYEQGCKDRDEQIRDAECDFYQRGLDDAIDMVKWLFRNVPDKRLFNGDYVEDILNLHTWEQIKAGRESYEQKQTDDEYVDAVIEVRVPKWQIGQDVSVFFKDSMNVKGKVEQND